MNKIILIGMKACGKTTVGKILSEKLNIPYIELDQEIEKRHFFHNKEKLSCREIFKRMGKIYFRNLETTVLSDFSKILSDKSYIFSCGGGTPLKNNNRKILRRMGTIIFLDTNKDVIWERILKDGIPSFFPNSEDSKKALDDLLEKRLPVYRDLAKITVQIDREIPIDIADKICRFMNI